MRGLKSAATSRSLGNRGYGWIRSCTKLLSVSIVFCQYTKMAESNGEPTYLINQVALLRKLCLEPSTSHILLCSIYSLYENEMAIAPDPNFSAIHPSLFHIACAVSVSAYTATAHMRFLVHVTIRLRRVSVTDVLSTFYLSLYVHMN